MAYIDFKDFSRRAASDKVFLPDKAFNIAKNPKYDGFQRCIAVVAYELFDKTSSGPITLGGLIKSKIMSNQQLAEELRKPVTRKIGKRKAYSPFKDNIFAADLADMQIVSQFNKGF